MAWLNPPLCCFFFFLWMFTCFSLIPSPAGLAAYGMENAALEEGERGISALLPMLEHPPPPSCLSAAIPVLPRAREAGAGSAACCQMAPNVASVILDQKKLRPSRSP